MPAKISKEVTDLGRSCRFLQTALTQQGDQVADLLVERVQPHREEGDEEPAFSASNVAFGRRLGGSMGQLVGADEKVYTLNARFSTLRNQRDVLRPKLAKGIVRLGRTIRGQYVAPDMEGLGLQSPRVRTLDLLLRQADLIDGVFQSDQLEQLLGDPAYEGEKVDPRAAAAKVVAIAAELHSMALELDKAQRDLDVAIIEKDELKDGHGEIFLYTARSFEAQCRLAGLKKLAEKVRPSVRQPGRRAQEVGEDDGDLPTDGLSAQDDVADPSSDDHASVV